MTLYIDTTDRNVIILRLIDGPLVEEYRKEHQQLHDQILLTSIDVLLQGQDLSAKDLTEIEVVCGPGSFTGTRVGVSVANGLGYSLGIPVNGSTIGHWVEPIYDRPANISSAK